MNPSISIAPRSVSYLNLLIKIGASTTKSRLTNSITLADFVTMLPISPISNVMKSSKYFVFFEISFLCLRSVYKELHADHETGAADNK